VTMEYGEESHKYLGVRSRTKGGWWCVAVRVGPSSALRRDGWRPSRDFELFSWRRTVHRGPPPTTCRRRPAEWNESGAWDQLHVVLFKKLRSTPWSQSEASHTGPASASSA